MFDTVFTDTSFEELEFEDDVPTLYPEPSLDDVPQDELITVTVPSASSQG